MAGFFFGGGVVVVVGGASSPSTGIEHEVAVTDGGCCLWAGCSPIHAGWRAGTSPQKDLLRQAEARGGGVLCPGGEHQESTACRRCRCPPGNQVQPPGSQTTAIRWRGRCILFSCVRVQYRSCIFSFLWFELLSVIVVTIFHWRCLGACVIYIWILYSMPSSVLCKYFSIVINYLTVLKLWCIKLDCTVYGVWQTVPRGCWKCGIWK